MDANDRQPPMARRAEDPVRLHQGVVTIGLQLFTCEGGQIVLPDQNLLLADRQSGGNLVINPPRAVWERSELTAAELTSWCALVAAAGRAMLDELPQLQGGCINYWEAGNWAVNDQAEPAGPKAAPDHRRVHLHLLGRSRTATAPGWRWGEAPLFPTFAERHTWADRNARLTAEECGRIVSRAASLLQAKYGFQPSQMQAWLACCGCGYPMPMSHTQCAECAAPGT